MTAEHPQRARTGRISDENFINALSRRYALIRGRYETIEQEAEFVTGMAALIDAQDRIDSERVLMRRVMGAIEIVAKDIDPHWSAGQVRPIYPRKRDASTGKIAATALSILRRERRPMRVREIARQALEAHGYADPKEQAVYRYDLAIRTSLDKRVGSIVGVAEGSPKRYFILARPSSNARMAADHSGAAASIPLACAKQGAELLRPASWKTADHC